MPTGYEPGLVAHQFGNSWNIFGCDHYAVYSNESVKLQPKGSERQLFTLIVPTSLWCPLGGKYHTLMNTPVFKKLWTQVLSDGTWKNCDWTVKADADAVFFPGRLHNMLGDPDLQDPQKDNGILINNCKYGMHGPVEVLTRRALEVYSESKDQCQDPPQEDVYLQRCLLRLGVRQVDQFDLLAEDHCDSKGWHECSGPEVAYHPFKEIPEYARCVGIANTKVLQEGYEIEGDDIYIMDTASAGACSAECTEATGCVLFTWEMKGSCRLRSLRTYAHHQSFGFVSGLPRNRELSVRLRTGVQCLRQEPSYLFLADCSEDTLAEQMFIFDAKTGRLMKDSQCLGVSPRKLGGKVVPEPCEDDASSQAWDPQGSPGFLKSGVTEQGGCLDVQLHLNGMVMVLNCDDTSKTQWWSLEIVQIP